MDTTRVGGYIRTLRTERNWTLAQLATRAEMSMSYLSDIEHGRTMPSLLMLAQIAAAFDMGAGDLLVDAGYTNRKADFVRINTVEVTTRYIVGGNGELRCLNHSIHEVE